MLRITDRTSSLSETPVTSSVRPVATRLLVLFFFPASSVFAGLSLLDVNGRAYTRDALANSVSRQFVPGWIEANGEDDRKPTSFTRFDGEQLHFFLSRDTLPIYRQYASQKELKRILKTKVKPVKVDLMQAGETRQFMVSVRAMQCFPAVQIDFISRSRLANYKQNNVILSAIPYIDRPEAFAALLKRCGHASRKIHCPDEKDPRFYSRVRKTDRWIRIFSTFHDLKDQEPEISSPTLLSLVQLAAEECEDPGKLADVVLQKLEKHLAHVSRNPLLIETDRPLYVYTTGGLEFMMETVRLKKEFGRVHAIDFEQEPGALRQTVLRQLREAPFASVFVFNGHGDVQANQVFSTEETAPGRFTISQSLANRSVTVPLSQISRAMLDRFDATGGFDDVYIFAGCYSYNAGKKILKTLRKETRGQSVRLPVILTLSEPHQPVLRTIEGGGITYLSQALEDGQITYAEIADLRHSIQDARLGSSTELLTVWVDGHAL